NAWKSFKFNAKKMTAKSLAGKQIVARYEYDRYDGTTYYSIYNTKGQWLGYVNAKAFK
ncbi:trypsin, partial [Weissella cibaria]|nr:trypsin [Weissella cibaria]